MKHISPGKCLMDLKGWCSSGCLLLPDSLCFPGERFPNGYGHNFPGISSSQPHVTPQWVSSAQIYTSLTKRENEKGKYVLSPLISNQKHTTQVTLSEHIPPCLVHVSAVPNNSPLTPHSSPDGTCALHSSSVPLPARRLIRQKATEIKRLVFISIHMGH